MGTRGAVGFKYDGKRLLAYNHFDSYPEELGVSMLAYAADSCTEPAQQVAVKQRLDQLVQVQEGEAPTDEQIEQLKRAGIEGPERVSSGMDWYAWLRDLQGQPDEYMRVGFWPENNDFLEDGLFCEWAYIVNIDDGVLEVHRGGDNVIARFALHDLPDRDTFLHAVTSVTSDD